MCFDASMLDLRSMMRCRAKGVGDFEIRVHKS